MRIFEFVVIFPAKRLMAPLIVRVPFKVKPSESLKSTLFNVTALIVEEAVFPLIAIFPAPVCVPVPEIFPIIVTVQPASASVPLSTKLVAERPAVEAIVYVLPEFMVNVLTFPGVGLD